VARVRLRTALPLVGRTGELDDARSSFGTVLSGRAATLLIEGEPGIGKSRLLGEFAADAEARGFTLLAGSAHELGSRPFGLFREMARADPDDHGSRALRASLDSATAGRSWLSDETFVVTEAIVEWVEHRCARTPVALVVEDLHWADASTLSAIGALVRHLRDRPLLIVGTLRSLPRSQEIDRLRDNLGMAGGRTLRLAGLCPRAIAELLERALNATPGERLRRLVDAAAGNPLFILELLTTLQQQGALCAEGDRVDASVDTFPVDLRQMLLLRYSFLPESTLDLLRLMAVVGSSCRASELTAISQREAANLLAVLRPALTTGLVDGSGDRLTFRHDMFRQALYDDVPVALRRNLHRDIGEALEAADAPASRVAEHLVLAGESDAHALRCYWRAARECARQSIPLAVHWYERAFDAQSDQDPLRSALITELAPLLVLSGRASEAESLAAPALHLCTKQSARVRLGTVLGHALVRQGRWREAGDQIAVAAEGCADARERDIALGPMTFLRLVTGRVAEAVAQAERSLAAVTGLANPVTEATALMTLTLGASAAGAVERARELGGRSVAVTSAVTTPFAGFLITDVCLGIAQADADHLTEARDTLRQGLTRTRRAGIATVLPYYQANLAVVEFHAGAWDDARTEAAGCLALARDTATRWNLHAIAILARIAIGGDELDAAEDLLAVAGKELCASGPVMGADWVLWARALLLEARQRPADAATTAAQAWDVLPELRFLHTNWMAPPDIVRLALAAGDTCRARQVTEETESAARRFGTGSATGAAWRCRALFTGDPSAALRAVEAYRGTPRPVEYALACGQAAVMLADSGATDEARPHFREAIGVLDERGVVRDLRRVTAALRGRGVRRGTRDRHRRATTGWPSLTETERSVAQLVSEGLTNTQTAERMFVSRYTIETHLKHIFTKLEVTSRTALAADVAGRQTKM
jgi:DNA-binding CsgD family transcriptional regulator/tetratricopeptide (TPR) repeat protein